MPSDYTPQEKKLKHTRRTIVAKVILDVCPVCGHPLIETRREETLIWDYGGAVREIVKYFRCTNPRCEYSRMEFSPTIRLKAPSLGISKRVLVDVLVWTKHGKTASWFQRHVRPTRVYLSGTYLRSVYHKYKKRFAMPPQSGKQRELLERIEKPVVLIEAIEPSRAPKDHKLIIATDILTGTTIYS